MYLGGVETWFVYGMDGELVAEYNANGAVGSPQKEYGYRGGQLLVVYDNTEPLADKKLQWMVADHLGTPRMVIDKTGSLSGIKRHDYLPFGEEIGANVGIRSTGNGYTADQIKQKFTGHQRDVETNLDFMQARYFSNVSGRFTSPDKLFVDQDRYEPQSWNLYRYAANNPMRYSDPTGRGFWEKFKNNWNGFGFISNADRDAQLVEKRKVVQGYLSEGLNTLEGSKSGYSYTNVSQMSDIQIWTTADKIAGGNQKKNKQLSDRQIDNIIDTDISGLVPGGNPTSVPIEKRLDKIYKRLGPYSNYCDKAAKQAQRQFAKDGIFAEIVEIQDVQLTRYIFSAEGKALGDSGFHYAVKVGDRFFDAMTGSKGATLTEYLKLFDPTHVLNIAK